MEMQESITDWRPRTPISSKDEHAVEEAPTLIDNVDDIDSFYASQTSRVASASAARLWEDNNLNIWDTVGSEDSQVGSTKADGEDSSSNEGVYPTVVHHQDVDSHDKATDVGIDEEATRSQDDNDNYYSCDEGENDMIEDTGNETAVKSDSEDEASAFSETLLVLGAFGFPDFKASGAWLSDTICHLLSAGLDPCCVKTLEDPDVDADKLRRHLSGMIRAFGGDLLSEATDIYQFRVALALRSKAISAHAANATVSRAEQDIHSKERSKAAPHNQTNHGIESNGSNEIGADPPFPTEQELDSMRHFFSKGKAFAKLKQQLKDLVWQTYERRLAKALGDTVYAADGSKLDSDEVYELVQDLSTAWCEDFTFSDAPQTWSQLFTGQIKMALGGVRKWWPFGTGASELSSERLCRVRFVGPGPGPLDAVFYINIPQQVKGPLQAAFATDPLIS